MTFQWTEIEFLCYPSLSANSLQRRLWDEVQKEEEKSPAASGCASKWHGGTTDEYCSPCSMSKRPRDQLGAPTDEEILVLKNKPKLLAFLFACQFGVSGRPLNVHSFVVMPSHWASRYAWSRASSGRYIRRPPILERLLRGGGSSGPTGRTHAVLVF